MRTLIVDNYDSFTYNLFQALAEIAGVRPTVVRNDEDWDLGELVDFDNVVISPGPGRPDVPRDFGLSRHVLAAARQPLLGVCLGHQGLCLLAGATVGRAPEVRHGRLSAVRHTGTELFAGLPSPMSVVRYHSLAVTDLPPSIEATAWAEDDVLMAVRHTQRPAWGVQFHPESVCTEHGVDLLANFAAMTSTWWAEHPRERVTLSAAEPVAAAGVERAPTATVLVERHLLAVTPEEAFDALYRDSEHSFWLDGDPTGDSRFAIIGDSSGPHAEVATADVERGTVTLRRAGVSRTEPFFDWLESDLARRRVRVPDLPFGFALGWVGYLGYELKAECGGTAAHQAPDPDATMLFADRAVVFDQHTGEVYLLALAPDDDDGQARAWLAATAETLAALVGAPAPVVDLEPSPATDVTLRHSRAEYLAMIEECLIAIRYGETYEVCLTNQVTARVRLDPLPAYRRLRRASPAPYGAYLRFGDLAVLSTSPERFLSVSSAGVAESRPIKGTRPRGATAAEDAALRADLASNEKDLAENLMIVDLVRNDLGRYAEIGSVRVPSIFDVETYATVHQLVSTVRAVLAPGVSAVRAARAAFPGGSMTGAPKIRTMEIIDRLEGGPRGVYSGAIGYFSLSGAADLNIVIRTLVVRRDEVSYGVGGAIIAMSDPVAEFEETAVKAKTMLDLLGVEFPDRAPVAGQP